MRVVSFDPGFTGGIAWLDLDAHTLGVCAMPVKKLKTSKGTLKTAIDEDALSELLARNPADEAWLEAVHSMPEQGVVSVFSFGEGFGVLKGCLAGAKIPRHYVDPLRWKTQLQVSAHKTTAKKQSWRFFPQCHATLTSSGKAEAALIGLYGVLTHATLVQSLAQPVLPIKIL